MLFSPLGLLFFGLLAQTESSISLISDTSSVRRLSVLLQGIWHCIRFFCCQLVMILPCHDLGFSLRSWCIDWHDGAAAKLNPISQQRQATTWVGKQAQARQRAQRFPCNSEDRQGVGMNKNWVPGRGCQWHYYLSHVCKVIKQQVGGHDSPGKTSLLVRSVLCCYEVAAR